MKTALIGCTNIIIILIASIQDTREGMGNGWGEGPELPACFGFSPLPYVVLSLCLWQLKMVYIVLLVCMCCS